MISLTNLSKKKKEIEYPIPLFSSCDYKHEFSVDPYFRVYTVTPMDTHEHTCYETCMNAREFNDHTRIFTMIRLLRPKGDEYHLTSYC